MPLRYLGYLAVLQAKYSEAASLFGEYLNVVRNHGTESDLMLGMHAAAVLSAAIQQLEPAVKLLAFAQARRRAGNLFMPATDLSQVKATVKRLSSQLGKNVWEQLSHLGENTSKEAALDMAFAVCVLAKQKPDEKLKRKASPTHPRSEAQNPHGLSKREIELLRLVAVGLSNAEIAARLFLSPNTVRAHLYSIYSKIDVTSRTAAAHYARRHNIA
jgi:DNA-binding CsgD family transcriptional regulator